MWQSLLLPLLASTAWAIWPLPTSQSLGSSVVWIEPDVKIQYHGPGSSYSTTLSADLSNSTSGNWTQRIIDNAISRTHRTLFSQNFVPWKFHPRNSDFEPSPGNGSKISTITLQQTAADPSNVMKPEIGDLDESYQLSMTAAGEATITAKSSIGLLYGLTTFTQLFFEHSDGGGVYSTMAPAKISDSPKFGWRGINVDTARTFKPMKEIMQTIDALSYNKMNRFHWHITDAQSWPLVIPSMPELANKGAYVSFQKYTPADVRKVYEYGALNGVEVVMEIDQPGHTSAIGYAYPELIAAFNVQPDWSTYSAEPPSGQFKLNDPNVSDFLEKMFDDLLPRLKPYTSYFHLGGDEVNANVYNLDDNVGTNNTKQLIPLLQKFMNRNLKQMKTQGFTPLVWQEQLLDWNLTLPKNTIVQVWEESDSVLKVVKQGHKALVGDYDFWYLDCGHGAWTDFQPGASERAAWPFLDYCNPLKNWKLIYSYNPLNGIPADLHHLVLGGEVHIWSEQTDASNFETMVWPRACAAGEVLWSGALDAQGQNRSQIDAGPRLNEMRERLLARGLRAEPPQMPFCTQNGASQCIGG